MTVGQGIFLGAVQGLTEFLPISSSGHLVIFRQLLGISEPVLTFDVVIHLATLLAILVFFGRSLFKVSIREWLLVGVGTIPAVIAGLLFKDQIEALFSGDRLVGIELMITGLINFYIDRKLETQKKLASTDVPAASPSPALNPLKSLGIGVAQAIAIIPGISRSGSTVAGAVGFGLDREQAFRFSFLLAIPALLGAGILQLKDVLEGPSLVFEPAPYIGGAITALIFGLASLALFKYVINKAKMEYFCWYCLIVGALTFLFVR